MADKIYRVWDYGGSVSKMMEAYYRDKKLKEARLNAEGNKKARGLGAPEGSPDIDCGAC